MDNKIGYNVCFQYSKYYKNKVGVGIGIDFSNFKQVSYQNGLFEKTNQTDIDGNKYDSWINSKMTYTTTLKYVEVPVMFHLIIGKGEALPFARIALQKNSINFYHMGVYADPKLLDWFVMEYPKHSNQKLDMGKSCIRFKNLAEIPYDLIGDLMKKVSVDEWIDMYEKNFKKK